MTPDELRQVAAIYKAGTWWWACEHPERPTELATRWHPAGDCHACELKLRAVQAQHVATGNPLRALECDPHLDRCMGRA